MAYIKIGQRMVDKSMHWAICAVHVLVDHPRNEVWSEGDDKCLGIVVVKVVVVVEICGLGREIAVLNEYFIMHAQTFCILYKLCPRLEKLLNCSTTDKMWIQ